MTFILHDWIQLFPFILKLHKSGSNLILKLLKANQRNLNLRQPNEMVSHSRWNFPNDWYKKLRLVAALLNKKVTIWPLLQSVRF